MRDLLSQHQPAPPSPLSRTRTSSRSLLTNPRDRCPVRPISAAPQAGASATQAREDARQIQSLEEDLERKRNTAGVMHLVSVRAPVALRLGGFPPQTQTAPQLPALPGVLRTGSAAPLLRLILLPPSPHCASTCLSTCPSRAHSVPINGTPVKQGAAVKIALVDLSRTMFLVVMLAGELSTYPMRPSAVTVPSVYL